MALFGSDKAAVLWDAVSVPNAFLCEYMPAAPEGYVKIYLYGLMYARFPGADEGLSVASLAKELGMEESDVTRAYQYWERCRLVARTQDHPPRYEYLSVQQAVLGKQAAPADEDYMQFAQALYAIFGDRRKLHGGETQLCYEWVEQLGLPREVVLMLVQHCMSTRGTQFSFKEAQKLALELCEQHVTTIEAAEDVFSRSEAAWKGTQKVLRRMSKFRAPTIDEIDLYVKWTTDWGFAPKAVETACAEMTGGDPSFKYLDSILKGLHERAGRGATTATQLEKQLTDEKRETEAVREVLAAAGLSTGVVSAGLREIYRDMAALVDHGTILLAAREVGRTKRKKSLDVIEELVKSWHARGLTNEEDVRAYLQLIEEQNRRLKALYLLAGSEKSPNAADRELLRKWRIDWSFADDVLELAAQYSAGADRPSSFMNKILESWRAAGVDTPQKAAADHEKHAERYAAPAQKGKTVIEQQYHQREYKPGQFDGLTEAELEEVRKFES